MKKILLISVFLLSQICCYTFAASTKKTEVSTGSYCVQVDGAFAIWLTNETTHKSTGLTDVLQTAKIPVSVGDIVKVQIDVGKSYYVTVVSSTTSLPVGDNASVKVGDVGMVTGATYDSSFAANSSKTCA